MKIKKCYSLTKLGCSNYSVIYRGCIKNGKCNSQTKEGTNKNLKKLCKALNYIYADNTNLSQIENIELK